MTIAYEFSTQISENGTLVVPKRYRSELPEGISVRVILLTEEVNGKQGHDALPQTDENLQAQRELEELVERIKRSGPDSRNITPASGDLALHLQEISEMSDPDFNLEEWTRQWDAIEAEMERSSLEHEAQEWQELAE